MRMRALTQARQAFRTRSWEASFSFTRRSLKVPKFERFANPPGNIADAVQEMRQRLAAERAAAKAAKLHPEDGVIVEDVLDEPVASTSISISEDLQIKMLTAPPSEIEQIQNRLHNLLASFEHAVNDEESMELLSQRAALPSPIGAAVSFSPPEPLVQASVDSGLKEHDSLEQRYEPAAKAPDNNEVRVACELCAKLLRKFKKHIEIYMEEQQTEQLIQQEQQRYSALEEHRDRKVEQLIAEELAIKLDSRPTGKTPSKGAGLVKGCRSYQSVPSLSSDATKWFAGSSLAAVRQLRGSRDDHRDKSSKSGGFAFNYCDLDRAGENFAGRGPQLVGNAGAKSAMEMDLGI